jgi:hypothetical protein
MLPALLVAITPMTIYLDAVINASGLEISAAVAAWTSTLILITEHADDPPPGLVAASGLSVAVLACVRGLSPLWVAIIALVAMASNPLGARRLLTRPLVRRWIAGLVVIGTLATTWILTAGSLTVLPDGVPVPHRASREEILVLALGRMGLFLREAIGVFGWLDTPSPLLTYLIWGLLGALMVATALLLGRRWKLIVFGSFLILVILLPALLIASRARFDGLIWQGRDGLPLWIGVPLLAACTPTRADRTMPSSPNLLRRFVALTTILACSAQLLAWYWALRRNIVGLAGPLDVFSRSQGVWHPPVVVPLLLFVAVLGTVSYATLGLHLHPRSDRRGSSRGSVSSAHTLQPAGFPQGGAITKEPRRQSFLADDITQVFHQHDGWQSTVLLRPSQARWRRRPLRRLK